MCALLVPWLTITSIVVALKNSVGRPLLCIQRSFRLVVTTFVKIIFRSVQNQPTSRCTGRAVSAHGLQVVSSG
jgi:hypothetical protein